MRVLIVSDTHGIDTAIIDVRKRIPENIDVFLHAGDVGGSEQFYRDYLHCQCHFAAGNTDWSPSLPETDIFPLLRHRVLLTHGHHYGVEPDGSDDLVRAALRNGCDIAVFGHTHIPLITKTAGVLVLNPGSLSRPRQPDHRPTFIELVIDDHTGELNPRLIRL